MDKWRKGADSEPEEMEDDGQINEGNVFMTRNVIPDFAKLYLSDVKDEEEQTMAEIEQFIDDHHELVGVQVERCIMHLTNVCDMGHQFDDSPGSVGWFVGTAA